MTSRFTDRPLSWSQLQAFQYNPADWYANYILGVKEPPNSLMLAGSRIGDAIGTDTSPIDNTLVPGTKEYTVTGTVDGISMIGHLDHWDSATLTLNENKCSDKKGRWTQKKVDDHGQITMYVMLLEQQDGVKVEDVTCYLNFILLEQVGVSYDVGNPPVLRRFQTRRTKEQVTQFMEDTKRIVALMHEYAEAREREARLSTPAPRPPAW